jgi:uncharacterized protein with GYD domain
VQAGDRKRHKINWQLKSGRGSVECKAKRPPPQFAQGGMMSKYIAIFTYSSGSWARMINSLDGDQTAVVQRTLESVGGSLECLYWQVGSHDGYFIFEAPDSVTAEAVEQAMTKTGAFKSMETHELLTQQQLIETLHLARDAAQVYEVPGQPD